MTIFDSIGDGLSDVGGVFEKTGVDVYHGDFSDIASGIGDGITGITKLGSKGLTNLTNLTSPITQQLLSSLETPLLIMGGGLIVVVVVITIIGDIL